MLKIHKIQLSPLSLIFISAALVNIFVWLYAYLQYRDATDFVPLHYTIYFGIDLIDDKTKLFAYPILGAAILAVNAILAYIFRAERLIGYILLGAALEGELLIAFALIALVVNYY